MRGICLLNNISHFITQKRGITSMNTSIKRSLLAVGLALAFCATLLQSSGVAASSGHPLQSNGAQSGAAGAPSQINGVEPNTCGHLPLFVFPVAPKQGDTVTGFVSVTTNTYPDSSFVVVTNLFDPSGALVSRDGRVVAVPANSNARLQITFSTRASPQNGNYAFLAESYPGDALPACLTCACSRALARFDLACNSNNCGPALF